MAFERIVRGCRRVTWHLSLSFASRPCSLLIFVYVLLLCHSADRCLHDWNLLRYKYFVFVHVRYLSREVIGTENFCVCTTKMSSPTFVICRSCLYFHSWTESEAVALFTRCTGSKCGFQTTDGAPEQFVLQKFDTLFARKRYRYCLRSTDQQCIR